jgi:hypothetical protein
LRAAIADIAMFNLLLRALPEQGRRLYRDPRDAILPP